MCWNMFKQLFKKKSCGENVLVCPRCNVGMEKVDKKDVIIDICNNCHGMWLDDNEINKLVDLAQNYIDQDKKTKPKKVKNIVNKKIRDQTRR